MQCEALVQYYVMENGVPDASPRYRRCELSMLQHSNNKELLHTCENPGGSGSLVFPVTPFDRARIEHCLGPMPSERITP